MFKSKRARVRALFVVPVLIASTLATVLPAASAGTSPRTVIRVTSGVAPGTSAPSQTEAKALETKALTASSGQYLTVGAVHDTGRTTCPPWSRPNCWTVIEVYWRAYTTCKTWASGLVKQCMNGTMVYAPGWTVCGTTCHLGGYYGTHTCDLAASYATGYNYDLSSCSESRVKNLTALVQRDVIKVCTIPAYYCNFWAFHVNMYYTSSITGPYGGTGAYS